MRTTVEITDQQRARLLEIAGGRGEKGFSRLVQEAIDLYLKVQGQRDNQAKVALKLKGSLASKEGEDLSERVAAVRERWR